MPFFTNNTGYIDTKQGRAAKPACTCDTRGSDPAEGGELVRAMQALLIANKVDQALERSAPLHSHGTAQPLVPRGLLTQGGR